ncbi:MULTISPECIES: PorP/SprF family type IX secretion system membrane protein [Zobellia]|uniref:PorP/SprF family type IX secretion system membrane protein n=1 Tax=Zobellia TaxID=112040 RepID=UPI00188D8210|nr:MULTISPECIES: PorP/SprF family type IX secretion system membrane protein [Zobellia]MBU2948704.1 PorP/SprF family type IX secretion system membrane protein [Zobellia uliginosa]
MKINQKIGKLALGVLLSLLSYNSSFGQQTAVFPEYNFNPFVINSAYAGLLPNTEVTITNTGFSSFEGSPKNFSLSFHSPISVGRQEGKIGIGAGLIRDEIGVTTSTSAFMAYSYKIFFDFEDDRPYWQIYQPGTLSFGITAGVQKYQDNLLELGIADDPNFSQNINATIPTIGIGFLFNHARFYAGVSSPNVLGDRLASNDDLKLESPIYGYFGYRFYNNRFEDFMLKPSILLKTEKGAPLQVDTNISISFKNRFELGAGYRSNSSVNLLAGLYLIKNFRLIYHYNMALKDSPVGNTHGIMLSYRFGKGYQSN